VRRGLPRRYVSFEADLATLRGRLDAQRQFTVLAATPQKLACRYEELSADIALNQIMRAAVTRLRPIAKAPETQRRLMELSLAFADISSVEADQLSWDRVVLDRTNVDWATLFKLAKLLLGDRFQTTSSGRSDGYALLFEMNTLFQEYVGRMLKRSLSGFELDVRLQGPWKYALTSVDGAQHRFVTKPDIVVSRDGRPVLIIDTKWKRLEIDDSKLGVGQADVYQLMAYARVYRCPRVLLLYPHHKEIRGKEGLLCQHLIQGTVNGRLSIATLALAELATVNVRLRDMVLSHIAPTETG